MSASRRPSSTRSQAAWSPAHRCSLDVPEVNRAAVSLAERNGMTPAFETARMYNKGEPELRLDKVYGMTTFELG